MTNNFIEKKLEEFDALLCAQCKENAEHEKVRCGAYEYEFIKYFLRTALTEAQANERGRVLEWAEKNKFQSNQNYLVFFSDLKAFLNQIVI